MQGQNHLHFLDFMAHGALEYQALEAVVQTKGISAYLRDDNEALKGIALSLTLLGNKGTDRLVTHHADRKEIGHIRVNVLRVISFLSV